MHRGHIILGFGPSKDGQGKQATLTRDWGNREKPFKRIEDCVEELVKQSFASVLETAANIVNHAEQIRPAPNLEQQSLFGLLVGVPKPTAAEARVQAGVRGKTKLFAEKMNALNNEWAAMIRMIADISRDASFIFSQEACSEDVTSHAYDILTQATGDSSFKEIEHCQVQMKKLMVVAKLEIAKANESALAAALQASREEVKRFEDQVKWNASREAKEEPKGAVGNGPLEAPAIDTTPLDTTSINRRTIHYLKQHGIKDVETLIEWTEEGLLGLYGIKQGSVDQIKRALKAKRLKLAKAT